MTHQFNLFPHKESRKAKVPISAECIRVEEKRGKEAAQALREIRYGLENFLKRMK
jgi:ribosomal protein L28